MYKGPTPIDLFCSLRFALSVIYEDTSVQSNCIFQVAKCTESCITECEN